MLAQYWIQRAPKICHWKFYPARQSDHNKGLKLIIGEERFDGKEIWVSPTVDREREEFDLAVWHPEWENLEESKSHDRGLDMIDVGIPAKPLRIGGLAYLAK